MSSSVQGVHWIPLRRFPRTSCEVLRTGSQSFFTFFLTNFPNGFFIKILKKQIWDTESLYFIILIRQSAQNMTFYLSLWCFSEVWSLFPSTEFLPRPNDLTGRGGAYVQWGGTYVQWVELGTPTQS